MINVTEQKPIEELLETMEQCNGIYIIGCGTCPTLQHTGGKPEVLDMKDRLEAAGKKVTGWMIIPTVCDTLTKDALIEQDEIIKTADCILVMSCSYGVQMTGLYSDKSVYPALNTLYLGLEEEPGQFLEVCVQCGNCVIGRTACICPLVRCAKGLLNGPCGGSSDGKCEISPDVPCGWQLIIDRLTALGRLDDLEEIEPLKNWGVSSSGGPRKINLEV
ncbi:methylenetetrahydrofolate reductase C-terminal domain-containing protein [Chloroflexota bacterium]